MTCSACVARIERVLGRTPGVQRAAVNLVTGTAVVEYQSETTSPDALGERITALGYPSRPRTSATPGTSSHPDPRHRDAAIGSLTVFALAMVLGAPLMHVHDPASGILAWIAMPFHGLLHRVVPGLWSLPHPLIAWILLILHLPVLLLWGRPFFVAAWKAGRNRSADMNTLVAVGTGSAFLLSLPSVLLSDWLAAHGLPSPLWFESVSGVIGFVSLGKLLEHHARQRTNRNLRDLVELLPDQARQLLPEGERMVPSATLLPGDVLLVRAGERVPADGIAHSVGLVDESHLTGEPLPRELVPGMPVQAGSLAIRHPLTLAVERAGEGTTIERVARLVEEAQSSKAPLQRTADRIAELFAPAVLGLSLMTFLLWLLLGGTWVAGLTATISVLVAACPCAMGLAVPSALAVALGRAARLGLLVRDAAALEALGRADTVVFDKTGTLSEGHPRLTRVQGTSTREELLGLAALVERDSMHPLAGPILEAARDLPVLALPACTGTSTTHPGKGVELSTERGLLRIGRADWALDGNASIPVEEPGETLVHLGLDGRWLGSLGLTDPERPAARPLVQALQERGIDVQLLSGDGSSAVEALARSLGVERWHARATPESKAAHIAALRSEGRIVAMVGDGINDAAALSASDAGIALESGAAVAFECASAVIHDPARLVDAIDLGRATVRTVKGNLAWAFGYNLLLIPVAAGILVPFGGPLLSPVLAGAAMSLSSVSVMLHSLRLLGYRPR